MVETLLEYFIFSVKYYHDEEVSASVRSGLAEHSELYLQRLLSRYSNLFRANM